MNKNNFNTNKLIEYSPGTFEYNGSYYYIYNFEDLDRVEKFKKSLSQFRYIFPSYLDEEYYIVVI